MEVKQGRKSALKLPAVRVTVWFPIGIDHLSMLRKKRKIGFYQLLPVVILDRITGIESLFEKFWYTVRIVFPMKSPINRTAILFASAILGLVVLDGLIQLRNDGWLGSTLSWHVRPDSAMAFFLLGLTLGMIGGIGLFFAHLIWRQKLVDEETRELDLLLEEVALAEDDDFSLTEDSMVDERGELKEPWERPADWWMNPGED